MPLPYDQEYLDFGRREHEVISSRNSLGLQAIIALEAAGYYYSLHLAA